MTTDRPWGQPLPGPIETAPRGADLIEAAVMLDNAVAGMVLGAYDRRMVAWLAGWDQPTIATLASVLARARSMPSRTLTEDER